MPAIRFLPFIFFLFLSLLVWIIYLPGAQGGFLLDDFINLQQIGNYGQVDTFEKLKLYLISGFSGPTGRPISLASFLLDTNTWPANPESFKHTNIAFHILTSFALLWFFVVLSDAPILRRIPVWVPYIAAAMWAMHPLWVSSTLYIVQRMTILSALFSILALVFFCKGLNSLERDEKGWWIIHFTTVGIFALIGVFSKENAVLLPLFCLIIRRYFYPNKGKFAPHYFINISLIGASVILGVYFVYSLGKLDWSLPTREFSMGERLVAEHKVIVIYLYHLVIPKSLTVGLNADAIVIPNSYLGLLPYFIVVYGLLACAYLCRKSQPILSVAILFFYVGHLIETVLVPLEIYYEHRNYLPSIFIFYSVCYYLSQLKRGRILGLLLASILAIYGWTLHGRVSYWKDTEVLPLFWAEKAPFSSRAQVSAANYWMARGEVSKALFHLAVADQSNKASATSAIFIWSIKCMSPLLDKGDFEKLIVRVQYGTYHIETFKAAEKFYERFKVNRCYETLDNESIFSFFRALRLSASKHSKSHEALVVHALGKAELELNKDGIESYRLFRDSLKMGYDFDMGFVQVAMLAKYNQYESALNLLRFSKSIYSELSKGGDLKRVDLERRNEFDRIEFNLKQDLLLLEKNQVGKGE